MPLWLVIVALIAVSLVKDRTSGGGLPRMDAWPPRSRLWP